MGSSMGLSDTTTPNAADSVVQGSARDPLPAIPAALSHFSLLKLIAWRPLTAGSPFLKCPYVGDNIVHIVRLDHDVRHRRMCEVVSQTVSAVAVIPLVLATSAKGGAVGS
jgi:hypothetical protein